MKQPRYSTFLLLLSLFLQVELRASKQKVKLKGQVTNQQDNLLNERLAAIEKAQAENATLRNELAILKADMEGKKKKVNVLQFIVHSCIHSCISLSVLFI